jgi:hypothetical protein
MQFFDEPVRSGTNPHHTVPIVFIKIKGQCRKTFNTSVKFVGFSKMSQQESKENLVVFTSFFNFLNKMYSKYCFTVPFKF